MIHPAILASSHLNALFNIVRSAVCLGRILLLVVAIEMLTMPFTQGLWTWDKFLHGGQDFELGLLVIITCLCLLLLRTEQSKHLLGLLLLIKSLLVRTRERAPAGFFQSALSYDRRPRIPLALPAASFDIPLLI